MEGIDQLEQLLSITDVLYALGAAVIATRLFGLGWDFGAIATAFLAAWLVKPLILGLMLGFAVTADNPDNALTLFLAMPLVSGVVSTLALALIGCLIWTSVHRA